MLQGRTYVPMLHARLAEMRALRELPNVTKNKIFPVIKARPWLNARTLDRLWETIEASFPSRSFGLDLDRTRLDPANTKEAYQEFCRLFDPAGGYASYYEQVSELENAVPVLRFHSSEPLALDTQLDHVGDLDRGLIIRVVTTEAAPVSEIAAACAGRSLENVVFVIDAGWGRDILLQAAICVGLISTISEYFEESEFVVGGSSFPNSFANQGERFFTSMIEQQLFSEVRRNVNIADLYYGDWGSTRPPTDPIPMRNVPRIDMPIGGRWLSWRSDDGESYEDVAERAVEDDDWSGGIGVWGEYMIESTAEGLSPAIGSPAMAAAVRVNMHLHLMANFDSPDELIVPDEPFDEDL